MCISVGHPAHQEGNDSGKIRKEGRGNGDGKGVWWGYQRKKKEERGKARGVVKICHSAYAIHKVQPVE